MKTIPITIGRVLRLLIPITIGTIFIRYIRLRLLGLIPRVLGAEILLKSKILKFIQDSPLILLFPNIHHINSIE